jgi:DNA-binding transcriptional ArsR family regulator
MVEYESRQLDVVFQALSDGTRRRMLRNLSMQPHSVGELAAPFQISLAAASKHIKVLERAGLVQRQIQGRTHLCHLRAEALAAGEQWLRYYQQFWSERLDAMEATLRTDPVAATHEPTKTQAKHDTKGRSK